MELSKHLGWFTIIQLSIYSIVHVDMLINAILLVSLNPMTFLALTSNMMGLFCILLPAKLRIHGKDLDIVRL